MSYEISADGGRIQLEVLATGFVSVRSGAPQHLQSQPCIERHIIYFMT